LSFTRGPQKSFSEIQGIAHTFAQEEYEKIRNCFGADLHHEFRQPCVRTKRKQQHDDHNHDLDNQVFEEPSRASSPPSRPSPSSRQAGGR
jgi:hypothetical protein